MAYIKTSKDIKTCFTNPWPFNLVICRNLSCLHLPYYLFQEMVLVFILETLVPLLFSLTCKIYIFKSRDFNANSLDLYTHKFGSNYWVKFSPILDENVKCGCIQIHVHYMYSYHVISVLWRQNCNILQNLLSCVFARETLIYPKCHHKNLPWNVKINLDLLFHTIRNTNNNPLYFENIKDGKTFVSTLSVV